MANKKDVKELLNFLKFLRRELEWNLYKVKIMNCPICQKRNREWQEEFNKRRR